jgi:hypothetical protein
MAGPLEAPRDLSRYVADRYYVREEEFLDEFYDVATVAAQSVADDWHPNASCDEEARQQQQYFLSSGELTWLIFDGASVSRDADGFSAQISLRSCKRVVTVRVRRVAGDLVAERIVDRAP